MTPRKSGVPAAARGRGSSPRRSRRLAVEIVAVLAVKLAALVAIWSVWFDDPQDRDIDGEDVARAIYAAPAPERPTSPRDAPGP